MYYRGKVNAPRSFFILKTRLNISLHILKFLTHAADTKSVRLADYVRRKTKDIIIKY